MKRSVATALKTVTLLAGSVSVWGVLGMAGCKPPIPPEPKRIEEIRPIPPALRVTNFTIQRRDLVAALGRGGDNSIRLVPVYETVASRSSYEHRAFDVRPGGVYSLLGLQNADIVVAVDGYLVKRPEQFTLFVQALAQEDEATIEIRRGGEPRLLKYVFIPARAAMASPTQTTPSSATAAPQKEAAKP
jgi:membrane-associated protease RseP (regulator of RpoE activity)